MAYAGAVGSAEGRRMGEDGEGGSGAAAGPACWFCSKGRHAECMRELPVPGRSDGPHDCAFDTALVP